MQGLAGLDTSVFQSPSYLSLVAGTGRFEALCHPGPSVWWGKSQTSSGEEGIPPDELQELSWPKFSSNPTQQWDNNSTKHKKSNVALGLQNGQTNDWVELQLTALDAGIKAPPGRSARHQGHVDVGMCKRVCEYEQISGAVHELNLLVQRGCQIPNNLFYRVLHRCIAHKDLFLGKRIHALCIRSGYGGDSFLASHLIRLYASHGRMEEAMRVFTQVSTPDTYNWATIIFSCATHGQAAEAMRLYREMRESSVKPDNRTYSAVLKACAMAGDLVTGKEVHAHILGSPGEPDIFVHTGLIDMYAKCGSLEDARTVFDRLPQRDVVTWNAMLAGYVQHGMGQDALSLYNSMQQEGFTLPSPVTFVCLLQACAKIGLAALPLGKELHAQIEERGLQCDVVVGTSIVDMYAKCNSLGHARAFFDFLPDKNVVTWNAMLAGYTQQGKGEEAIILYHTMQQEGITLPDSITFVCLLQACAVLGALPLGKQLHAQIEERGLQDNVVLGGSLVYMYAKCSTAEDARRVFDSLPERNVVAWNVMIAVYAELGMGEESLSLYKNMEQEGLSHPDSATFVCLLQSCACLGVQGLHQGKQVHVQIEVRGLQDHVVVGGSLVNMYAKCGSLVDARSIFDKLPDRNVVTWNVMLAGYTQQGKGGEAFDLYATMQQEGMTPPDFVTFVCLLQACASVGALDLGKQLHVQIKECGLQAHIMVGGALVNMYAKCGSTVDSHQAFDSLPVRTPQAWNALLGGYSRQGDIGVVFDLLDRMAEDGIEPGMITFLTVLTACSHAGLVDRGWKYFRAMCTEFSVSPTAEHYTCLMDLLGRAGHLEEALLLAKTMPGLLKKSEVWHTLLGTCQKWNNVKIGQQAFEYALSVDEQDAASYGLMSNIYASAEMWKEAKEMQARRVTTRARKEPGKSWWTDMSGVVHMFLVGDKNQPQSESVYSS